MPYEVNVELLVRGIIFEVDDLKEMSFKRDGDDLTLLDNLQVRKITKRCIHLHSVKKKFFRTLASTFIIITKGQMCIFKSRNIV